MKTTPAPKEDSEHAHTVAEFAETAALGAYAERRD
jgi:hypothetical protein